MIIKCSYCGGPLKFDADLWMMVCEHCTSMFPVEETAQEKRLLENDTDAADDINGEDNIFAEDSMECRIYECKSCGAQLVLNDVETATYCAYCGQPTIVFERIARRRRPKYIIPFSIPQNIALANIRAKFLQGKFVPDEIKNAEPELLRGIYVPYMLYDIRYKDTQLICGNSHDPSGSKSAPKYYCRKAVASFHDIPVDAARRLPNELSERLEPFSYNGMVDFKVEYLSGFYADLKDDFSYRMEQTALARAEELFDQEVSKTVAMGESSIIRHKTDYEFEKREYVLFPVWFMVFHKKKQTFTVLVNGQTGKVVGALPPDRKKAARHFFMFAVIFSILGALLMLGMSKIITEDIRFFNYTIYILSFIPLNLFSGFYNLKRLKNSRSLTGAETMKKFVKERQDS